MGEKKYCGKGKFVRSSQYGDFFRITFSPDDIELMLQNRTETGWLNLIMTPMQKPDRRGNTDTLYIDEWRPDGNRGGNGGRRLNRGGDQRSGRREPPAADPDYGPPTASGRDDGGFGADNPPPPPPEMPLVDDDIPF